MSYRHLLAATGALVFAAAPAAAARKSTISHALLFQNRARTMDCGVEVPLSHHQPSLVLCSAGGIPRPKGVGDPFVQIGRRGEAKVVLVGQDEFETNKITTLKPGDSWSNVGVTCKVMRTSVTCTNASKHGFTIGNGRFKRFCLGACSSAALVASPLKWSAPATIDTQIGPGGFDGFNTVACPDASLCVAGGGDGLFTSTNPVGGKGAWVLSRKSDITDVSCPSSSWCAAVDLWGNLLTSSDPTGGTGAWRQAHLTGESLDAVSCVSASLCAVLDGGSILISRQPAAGAGAWTQTDIDGSNSLVDVSCPSAVLCVAIDNQGNVLTSTNPTGGTQAWSIAKADPQRDLSSVTCTASGWCAVADLDTVLTSTDPTDGASAWRVAKLPDFVSRVSCPSRNFCAAVGDGLFTSSNPTGGPGAWTATNLYSGLGPLPPCDFCVTPSVSCPSASFCTVVDGYGLVFTSDDPVGGRGAWSTAEVDTHISLGDVSCPNGSLCFAIDSSPNALRSADPGGVDAWKAAYLGGVAPGPPEAMFTELACPSKSLCLAVDSWFGPPDGSDVMVVSVHPSGPSTAWRQLDPGGPKQEDGFYSFAGLTCTSPKLCAVDVDGALRVSTNPARAGSWRNGRTKGQRSDVSCPRGSRCVALGGACPSVSLCVVPNGGGKIAISTHPSARRRGWESIKIDSHHSILKVSCPTTRLCVALDDGGNLLITAHPTRGISDWRTVRPDHAGLVDLSCPTASFCIGVDGMGRRVLGTRSSRSVSAGSR